VVWLNAGIGTKNNPTMKIRRFSIDEFFITKRFMILQVKTPP